MSWKVRYTIYICVCVCMYNVSNILMHIHVKEIVYMHGLNATLLQYMLHLVTSSHHPKQAIETDRRGGSGPSVMYDANPMHHHTISLIR